MTWLTFASRVLMTRSLTVGLLADQKCHVTWVAKLAQCAGTEREASSTLWENKPLATVERVWINLTWLGSAENAKQNMEMMEKKIGQWCGNCLFHFSVALMKPLPRPAPLKHSGRISSSWPQENPEQRGRHWGLERCLRAALIYTKQRGLFST